MMLQTQNLIHLKQTLEGKKVTDEFKSEYLLIRNLQNFFLLSWVQKQMSKKRKSIATDMWR